jgi:LAO/AO transport system kinase
LKAATPGWTTEVALCSGLTGEGIHEAWQLIQKFYGQLEPGGVINKRRQQQSLEWLSGLVHDELVRRFYHDPKVKERLAQLQQQLLRGETTPVRAARELLDAYRRTV